METAKTKLEAGFRAVSRLAFYAFGALLLAPVLVAAQESYDLAAEQHILDLSNQARAQAGLAPLKLDPGLSAAARQHSALMASQKQLSHDLPGEPALPQRLAATSKLELSSEAENVSLAPSVDDSHQGFMHSAHHRANLLDADFNLAGIGVVHTGHFVYVTQDFARAQLPHTPTEAANLTIAAVDEAREQSGLPQLHVSE